MVTSQIRTSITDSDREKIKRIRLKPNKIKKELLMTIVPIIIWFLIGSVLLRNKYFIELLRINEDIASIIILVWFSSIFIFLYFKTFKKINHYRVNLKEKTFLLFTEVIFHLEEYNKNKICDVKEIKKAITKIDNFRFYIGSETFKDCGFYVDKNRIEYYNTLKKYLNITLNILKKPDITSNTILKIINVMITLKENLEDETFEKSNEILKKEIKSRPRKIDKLFERIKNPHIFNIFSFSIYLLVFSSSFLIVSYIFGEIIGFNTNITSVLTISILIYPILKKDIEGLLRNFIFNSTISKETKK